MFVLAPGGRQIPVCALAEVFIGHVPFLSFLASRFSQNISTFPVTCGLVESLFQRVPGTVGNMQMSCFDRFQSWVVEFCSPAAAPSASSTAAL